ncbi:MAG: type II secretion system GspH family protein [Gemmatales bacterium]|nr:type II secretion system GspH family protein [Gemmatales bacterium]MDW8224304.1 type II secretion system protein [Gemmatales bacterium]
MCSRRTRPEALTLLELLVVMAIIAVLAGLLLPALTRAKLRAQQVVCVNNFKQLTAAWKLYADDHQGRLALSFYFFRGQVNTCAWVRGSMDDDVVVYPPVEAGVRDSTNRHGIEWGSFYAYARALGLYRCAGDSSAVEGRLRVRSYAMNGWMGGTWVKGQSNYVVFRREQDVVRPGPSRTWVFIDEHERSINDGWFAVDMEGRRGLLDAPAVRHGGAYGLSFADGHVEVWPLQDGRTLRWARLPIPNTPLNPDWARLAAATTSLK